MAIKRAAFKELQHRAQISERFKELFFQTGLGLEGVAQTLHVTPRTVRNWLSGNTAIPYSAYKLLRVQRYFELPGQGWSGWHMHSGKLWSPEGHGFMPTDSSWWSLLVRQARCFQTVYNEIQQLKRQLAATELAARETGPRYEDRATSAAVRVEKWMTRPVTRHFSPFYRKNNQITGDRSALLSANHEPFLCPASVRYARVSYSINLPKAGI